MSKLLIKRIKSDFLYLLLASTVSASLSMAPAQAKTIASNVDLEMRNKAKVTEAFERWSGGGSVFAGLLSDDIVWTIHGSGPVAGTYHGIKDFIEKAAAPITNRLASPLIPDVQHIWAVNDRVIIRFDASAPTTSGATYKNQFVWIFRMENDMVVEAEAFLDLAAYQQVVENNPPLKQ